MSPQILILRMAEGKAWEKDRVGSVGVDTLGGGQSDGSGAVALHLEMLPYHPQQSSETDSK